MKKSKIISRKLLVLILAVILLVCCISTSTFSWFTRPLSNPAAQGRALNFTIPDSSFYYPNGSVVTTAAPKVYDGHGVSMSTYVSNDDGVSFSTETVNPARTTQEPGSLGVNPYDADHPENISNRIYYKTELVNNTTTPQNVSLYIKNFKPGGTAGTNVCVGVNVPIKAFKNYSRYGVTIPSPTTNKTNGSTKRVYFNPVGRVPSGSAYDEHRQTWNVSTFYVKTGSNVDNNVESSVQMTQCANNSEYWYADIPSGHNQLYFSVTVVPDDYQRTQTFSNLSGDGLSMTQSLMFYTNGRYTDYNNAWAGKEYCTGANIASYYNYFTIASVSGQTVSAALDSSQYQSNSGISYSSSDSGVFAVSNSGANAGTITPVANLAATTTATLTYTVTSQYGDTKEATATVQVKAIENSTATIKNAPIVTNLLIPAATVENKINGDKSNVQDVYWFIQNGDEMYGAATANATYTLDGIYLGV